MDFSYHFIKNYDSNVSQARTQDKKFDSAIVGGEIVAKGTQPWIGVVGSTQSSHSTAGPKRF